MTPVLPLVLVPLTAGLTPAVANEPAEPPPAQSVTIQVVASDTKIANSRPFDGFGDFALGPVFLKHTSPPDLVICILRPGVPEHDCSMEELPDSSPRRAPGFLDRVVAVIEGREDVDPLSVAAEAGGRLADAASDLAPPPSRSPCVDSHACERGATLTDGEPLGIYVFDDDVDTAMTRLGAFADREIVDMAVFGDPADPRLGEIRRRLASEVAAPDDPDAAAGRTPRDAWERRLVQQIRRFDAPEDCLAGCALSQSTLVVVLP